jgi:hypothetical protein
MLEGTPEVLARERVSGAIATRFESLIAPRVTGSKSDAVWSLVIEGDLISVCILPAHLVGIPVVVNAALAIHRHLNDHKTVRPPLAEWAA